MHSSLQYTIYVQYCIYEYTGIICAFSLTNNTVSNYTGGLVPIQVYVVILGI